MSDTLALPGDIPGLLRRGSPAIYQPRPRYQTSCLWRPGAEVVVLATWQRGDATWVDVAYGCGVDSHPAICVALDLTDATGRAHAAWWLASDVSARWSPCTFVASAGPSWMVTALKGGHSVTTYGARSGWCVVPGLARLDPHDTRLLPDGSRWVDAEAERLVGLHVSGRAP